jgi:hypothetical protein
LEHLIFQQLELLRQISIDPAKEVAQTCSLLCSRREHLSFLKQGRGSAGTSSPGTANAKGRGTRETSRDKAAEVRAGLAEAAPQEANSRHWIKLRPPGLGLRLSSAAFLVREGHFGLARIWRGLYRPWIMQSSARTVQEYLKELPADRREAINAVRGVILANLPRGYEECMSYGMIGYVVPHSIYPKGYQCNPKLPLPFVNLGSQKNHMALHLMCCYGDPKLKAGFEKAWKDAGKKFDMGGGCVRFKALEDVPLEVIGRLVASLPVDVYIGRIEKLFAELAEARAGKKTAKRKSAKRKPKRKV